MGTLDLMARFLPISLMMYLMDRNLIQDRDIGMPALDALAREEPDKTQTLLFGSDSLLHWQKFASAKPNGYLQRRPEIAGPIILLVAEVVTDGPNPEKTNRRSVRAVYQPSFDHRVVGTMILDADGPKLQDQDDILELDGLRPHVKKLLETDSHGKAGSMVQAAFEVFQGRNSQLPVDLGWQVAGYNSLSSNRFGMKI